MKLFERSPFSGENRSISFGDRLKGIWRFGLTWDRDLQAQQVLITQLQKTLDNKYILLHNMTLPGLPMPVPLILIGPPGVKAIYASALKGVFRAKGENWYALDARNKRYIAVQPNLLKRTYLMSQAVQDFLSHRDILTPGVEPVLFFSQPGLHVEPVQPIMRLVQRDGIDRFLTSVLQSPVIMSSTDGQIIADMFIKSGSKNPSTTASPETSSQKNLKVKKRGMKPWQWFVIGLLILSFLAVLVGIAYIFLLNF